MPISMFYHFRNHGIFALPERLISLTAFGLVSLLSVCLLPVPQAGFLPASQAKPRIDAAIGMPPIADVDHPPSLDGALGLGDIITLSSAREPIMLPMARAERIVQRRSGDALIALPPSIRGPFRAVLAGMGGVILPARVVVLPLAQQRSETLLPMLRFASGAVDIYAEPVSSTAAEAMEQWLSTQDLPPLGHLQPLLLKLVPMPEALTLIPRNRCRASARCR